MREMFIFIATTMPTNQLIDELKEALFNYELEATKENKQKLEIQLQMLQINLQTDGKIENATQMIDNFKRVESVANIFSNNN